MKLFLLRTLYRVLITLVLLLAIPCVLVAIPLDMLLSIWRAASAGIVNAYDEIVEDLLLARVEVGRVGRAFVEAFRRGMP